MVKKSKYRLFSYILEDNLIYYKSLRENNKIISFAVLECLSYYSIASILNDMLQQRVIQYYSVEIETNYKDKNLILLNFEETNKEKIIEAFNLVKQNLARNHESIEFLKEQILEERFLVNFFQHLSSSTIIIKSAESIIISNENKSIVLTFFTINFDFLENKKSFISNFLNLIINIGGEGFLILNFKLNNSENVNISPYFVLKSDSVNNTLNIESKVNNFFQSNLLKKDKIKIKTFSNFIWRLGINNTSFLLNDNYNLFYSKDSHHFLSLSEMNEFFEVNLSNNQIEYIRLSKYLLFIEQRYLFLILENLECDYIYKIIEKYISKFLIYILILNDLGHKELQKKLNLKLIENIKIVNPLEIRDFNFKQFKENDN